MIASVSRNFRLQPYLCRTCTSLMILTSGSREMSTYVSRKLRPGEVRIEATTNSKTKHDSVADTSFKRSPPREAPTSSTKTEKHSYHESFSQKRESTLHSDTKSATTGTKPASEMQGKQTNMMQPPRTRPDWKYLPDWRRQTLSIKHKIEQKAASASPTSSSDQNVGKVQWNPPKKLSPDAMNGIRILHKQHPEYNLVTLADQFQVSPEVIRRILKSKWQPTAEEAAKRDARWKKRKHTILQAQKQKALNEQR